MEKCKITTWRTYRKSIRKFYQVQDGGGKGWARTTVGPTMTSGEGFLLQSVDIHTDERKPRQILIEDYRYLIDQSSEIVYHVSGGSGHYAGHFTILDIYYIRKDGKQRPIDPTH